MQHHNTCEAMVPPRVGIKGAPAVDMENIDLVQNQLGCNR